MGINRTNGINLLAIFPLIELSEKILSNPLWGIAITRANPSKRKERAVTAEILVNLKAP